MCGGGGGGASEQLAMQSANQEQARQARINEGMQRLESMFNGGRVTSGRVGAGEQYDPTKTYYNKDGSVFTPQRMPGGSALAATQYTPVEAPTDPISRTLFANQYGGKSVDEVNAAQLASQGKTLDEQYAGTQYNNAVTDGLFTGVEDVQGYGPDFYQKAYDAQLGYALPQVDKQFQDAQRNLTFALARQGLSESSQGYKLKGDLDNERALAIQGEQDKANTVRVQQQQAVEDERGELTRLLQSTGDVESTMNMAASRKNMLNAAPSLATVGPLFQNATGTLADMIVNPAIRQSNANRGTTGYGSGKGSGTVVT